MSLIGKSYTYQVSSYLFINDWKFSCCFAYRAGSYTFTGTHNRWTCRRHLFTCDL